MYDIVCCSPFICLFWRTAPISEDGLKQYILQQNRVLQYIKRVKGVTKAGQRNGSGSVLSFLAEVFISKVIFLFFLSFP